MVSAFRSLRTGECMRPLPPPSQARGGGSGGGPIPDKLCSELVTGHCMEGCSTIPLDFFLLTPSSVRWVLMR